MSHTPAAQSRPVLGRFAAKNVAVELDCFIPLVL